jgi:hypothetical protein
MIANCKKLHLIRDKITKLLHETPDRNYLLTYAGRQNLKG